MSHEWARNHISEAVRHFRFWLFQINCVTFLIFLLPLLRSPAMASLPPVDWFAMRAGLAASRLPLRNPAPAFRVHILHAYIHIEKRPPKNCASEIWAHFIAGDGSLKISHADAGSLSNVFDKSICSLSSISTNTFCNLDKYIWQFGQIQSYVTHSLEDLTCCSRLLVEQYAVSVEECWSYFASHSSHRLCWNKSLNILLTKSWYNHITSQWNIKE